MNDPCASSGTVIPAYAEPTGCDALACANASPATAMNRMLTKPLSLFPTSSWWSENPTSC
jgi:hypothetical protein